MNVCIVQKENDMNMKHVKSTTEKKSEWLQKDQDWAVCPT